MDSVEVQCVGVYVVSVLVVETGLGCGGHHHCWRDLWSLPALLDVLSSAYLFAAAAEIKLNSHLKTVWSFPSALLDHMCPGWQSVILVAVCQLIYCQLLMLILSTEVVVQLLSVCLWAPLSVINPRKVNCGNSGPSADPVSSGGFCLS